MIEDAQGHSLSGATPAAVATYNNAVRAFNLVHGDAVGLFEAARDAAPDLVMAYCGQAWALAPPCPIWSTVLAPPPSHC